MISSSQLQNNSAIDQRSIHTTAKANVEVDEQHSSEKHNNEISEGVSDCSYARSIQIGALIALCYNLFSSTLRLRSIQSQKQAINGSTNKRQVLRPERRGSTFRQFNKHETQGIIASALR